MHFVNQLIRCDEKRKIFTFFSIWSLTNDYSRQSNDWPQVCRQGNFPCTVLSQMAQIQEPAEGFSFFIRSLSFKSANDSASSCLAFPVSPCFNLKRMKTFSNVWLVAALLCILCTFVCLCESADFIYSCWKDWLQTHDEYCHSELLIKWRKSASEKCSDL